MHLYTFLYISSFAGFGAEVFESTVFLFGMCLTKNAAPLAAIFEIKQFTYATILYSIFWQMRHTA
jgi:hypothetical protein